MSTTKPKIPLEEVTSSNISAAGYDPTKRIMAVQFKSGLIIHYAEVPLETVTAFYIAESKGKFYSSTIRSKFPAEAMTGPCPACGDTGWIGDKCVDCGTADYQVKERPQS